MTGSRRPAAAPRAAPAPTPTDTSDDLSASAQRGARVTVVLVLALGVVTLLGTRAAIRDGVMAAQARYFDSFVAWQDLPWGLSVPLPGARSLLWLLLAALLLNRAAWRPRRGRLSVVAIHLGVAALVAGAVLAPPPRVDGSLWLQPDVLVHTLEGRDGAPIELPFGLCLRSYERRFHPGTSTIASIEAVVEVVAVADGGTAPLTVRVTPNRPLRRDGYAVYLPPPSADDPVGVTATRFVVAHSHGRGALLAVSALLALALVWHFVVALWRHMRAPQG